MSERENFIRNTNDFFDHRKVVLNKIQIALRQEKQRKTSRSKHDAEVYPQGISQDRHRQ